MKLLLTSHGKSDVLTGKVDADLYIDCRGMVNPFRDPVLGGKTGDDPEVQKWIEIKNEDYLNAAVGMVGVALQTRSSRNSGRSNPDGPLHVAFFCLAGVHRSRGMKNCVGKYFKEHVTSVEVEIK